MILMLSVYFFNMYFHFVYVCVVFGKETGLRYLVAWLLTNHGGCNPAGRGSRVWKVNPKMFCYWHSYGCISKGVLWSGWKLGYFLCCIYRFADLFGARMALSLSCSATIVFFLLLAIADHPAMLFIHKLPTVFMHVLPGEHVPSSTVLLTQFIIFFNLKPRLL